MSQRVRFAFYPLLGLAMIVWLAWDWSHERKLDAAEDEVFNQVIQWRPLEPRPGGRDHYEVIRRQQLTKTGKDLAMAQVRAPGAAAYAKDYVGPVQNRRIVSG